MLLDEKGAAQWLGVSIRDVQRRVKAGTIPIRRLPSATGAKPVVRFHPGDLDAWSRRFREGPGCCAPDTDALNHQPETTKPKPLRRRRAG